MVPQKFRIGKEKNRRLVCDGEFDVGDVFFDPRSYDVAQRIEVLPRVGEERCVFRLGTRVSGGRFFVGGEVGRVQSDHAEGREGNVGAWSGRFFGDGVEPLRRGELRRRGHLEAGILHDVRG